MASHVFNLLIKIALLAVVMMIVARVVPYNGLVDSITGSFTYQGADKVTHFILGEPDLEVWQTLSTYISILINTFISIPAMSAIITIYSAVIHKFRFTDILKTLGHSTLRRFAKVFGFTFLFWVLFRLLPYQSVIPQQKYSNFTIVAIVIFQLLLTIVCYWFITKKIITTRSL
ncbi:TPA: hypothetical protein L9M75_005100 [Klebsiella pneumoniae]|uniref:Uncharacterized protein n=1 Tax=Klebsiella pneumoniae TaxID=573 RepID=A0A483I1V5_KLEPN|nr:hypothetical protein [Klebsiella pneumoniae]MBF8431062.1 hypothetical protein [Klebsiella pneumoniae]MBH8287924.1 hypothetical protein [Klebsiella pneumoniae]MBK2606618.1 hypothetical protein [Klebsiella pneumoniae]MBS2095795.1 hypothetical protein [Klebsiella pneumoniae]MCB8016537.1 hypothetical protein [Klebsiella pneumoniae]